MKQILVLIFKTYKLLITPIFVGVFGHGCKFTPSCSEYMREAVESFGAVKGLALGVRRFIRCHPFSKGHFDPVPARI